MAARTVSDMLDKVARGGGRRFLDPQGAGLRRGAATDAAGRTRRRWDKDPQTYATADLGVIAYETDGVEGNLMPGMLVNDELTVEIVTPGTSDPAPAGKVGEVVVTRLSGDYPLLRPFALGCRVAKLSLDGRRDALQSLHNIGNDAGGGPGGKALSMTSISAAVSRTSPAAAFSAAWARLEALGMAKSEGRRVRKANATWRGVA